MGVMNVVASSIKRFGGIVTVMNGGEGIRTRAFVQPLRYRNKIYIGGEYHKLGFMRREKYLYIGTADNKLVENHTVIQSSGGKYIVKRCETYYVNDCPIYTWAILVPFGEASEDDYDADTNAD